MNNEITVIGFDPGINNLGVGILKYNIQTKMFKVEHVFTLSGEKLIRGNDHIVDILGARCAKLELLKRSIVKVLIRYQPAAVASEAPYLGRFPQAFAALTECVYMERLAVYEYSSQMYLATMDPPTIKNAVGVGGKSGDKNEMTQALIKCKWIDFNGYDPLQLDEHSIDAIAVAYTNILRLECRLPEMPKKKPKKKRSRKKKKRKA